MAIYLKIKELRIKKNLSVVDVANATGFNRQNIYSWETGKTKPNPIAVKKLSEFFGVSESEIFSQVSDKTENSSPSTTWLQGLVDEYREKEKRYLDQIEKLTNLLSAQLGKLEGSIISGLNPGQLEISFGGKHSGSGFQIEPRTAQKAA